MSNQCPKCNQEAMGWLKKVTLGPGRTVACQNCGARVTVPVWTMVAVVPIVASIFLFNGSAFIIALIVLTLVMSAVWAYVPLVEK